MANILSRIIATFDLANRIRVLNPCANIDSQYGPYTTIEDAKTALTGILNENSVGRTIGITETDGKVTEYWWQTITDSEGNKTYDFVLKQSSSSFNILDIPDTSIQDMFK